MGGNRIGGLAARDVNYFRYGKDFYSRIGKIGGKVRNPKKGFGSYPEISNLTGKIYGHATKPYRKMSDKKKRELHRNYERLRKIHELALKKRELIKQAA